jgi:hypothetical protein
MNITLDSNVLVYSFVPLLFHLFTKTKRSVKNGEHSILKQEDFLRI